LVLPLMHSFASFLRVLIPPSGQGAVLCHVHTGCTSERFAGRRDG
jgi:hypothetical protein